ncbi:MAG TPA: hypothetical protein PKX25_10570, partial [Microthrixaceae bacterium]|nr:hypothetical protein [Microthrixaceae bacterium]
MTGSDTPTATGAPTIPTDDCDWIDALRGDGPGHHAAVRRLHDTVHRAAAHQVRRMPHVWSQLGAVRAQEIIDAAADEATTAVLGSLDRFEGRSRFSTWVFKFGILHAGTEARRALWRDRPVDLTEHPEPATGDHDGSASVVEARDLAAAVSTAIDTVLTARQRRVAQFGGPGVKLPRRAPGGETPEDDGVEKREEDRGELQHVANMGRIGGR